MDIWTVLPPLFEAGAHRVAQAVLRFVILLPWSGGCWDDGHALPGPALTLSLPDFLDKIQKALTFSPQWQCWRLNLGPGYHPANVLALCWILSLL